ncbi:hypothetical protein BKA57DRAFT_499596 [Linnemannia elongata]|nr:hypothetical protein BKA57DRAFT_499596 [Linnemannia elongata]
MSPPPLTSLDIVDNIILHPNSRQSLARASLVCKAWNTLYTPVLWRRVCYNYSYVHITPPDFKQHGVYVRRHEVEGLNNYLPVFIATRHCPYIEVLDLYDCNRTP